VLLSRVCVRFTTADELSGGTFSRLEDPLGAAFRDLAKASEAPPRRPAERAKPSQPRSGGGLGDEDATTFAATADILDSSREAASPSKAPAYICVGAADPRHWQAPR